MTKLWLARQPQFYDFLKKLVLSSLFISSVSYTFFCHAKSSNINLVTEYLPPYQIVNKDYSITGFATEIVLETLKRSQYTYNLNVYTWVRTYNLALQKHNTCIFSLARLPVREKLFKWIGPITEKNNAVVWGLKNNEHSNKVKTIEDLKHYTTAVSKNDATHIGMLKNGLVEGKHLYVLENTSSLLNLLVTRPEIDFIIADDITITHRAKLANVDINLLQRIIELKNLPLNFYLACSLNTEQSIVNNLTQNLSTIHQDGTYKRILAKWKDKMPRLK